ncbi:MAG: hypothetical protein IK134_06380 [Oscillospiraceae bacterium]|nr:hypothetical protein [Oscillospiraceae bacterium]MBQ5339427.1 hypothetical protein [Oscillospiraceae bacterium]MBQ9906270.1 hypothetical protein [Oscillospiraceae bacterium]MBR5362930.1 hypothetical protein [Oscillospiraceae bacterium]
MITFNETYDAYILEQDGILFRWEEQPDAAAEAAAADTAAAYHKNIREIAEFLIDDLIRGIWGISDPEQVIAMLGRPQIAPALRQVVYCEHLFDKLHVISFEYLDDEFLQLHAVDLDG